MRGRRKPKVKMPRAPRRKLDLKGKCRVVAPSLNNLVGVVNGAGPEQSHVVWLGVREGDDYPTEGFYPNDWLKPERVMPRVNRVTIREKIKVERVHIKTKRVRIEV